MLKPPQFSGKMDDEVATNWMHEMFASMFAVGGFDLFQLLLMQMAFSNATLPWWEDLCAPSLHLVVGGLLVSSGALLERSKAAMGVGSTTLGERILDFLSYLIN